MGRRARTEMDYKVEVGLKPQSWISFENGMHEPRSWLPLGGTPGETRRSVADLYVYSRHWL
jgi:hypothetical protein